MTSCIAVVLSTCQAFSILLLLFPFTLEETEALEGSRALIQGYTAAQRRTQSLLV